MPTPRKPIQQLRRGNRPEQWTILPHDGCKRRAPAWPLRRKPSVDVLDHWRHLWSLPVAAYWHEQSLSPRVVASYALLFAQNVDDPKPSSYQALLRMDLALGLSPEGMSKLRLTIEHPEAPKAPEPDPYANLKRKRKAQ